MKTRRLGTSAITVSDICMGTMTFGSQAEEKMSLRILDQAFEAGINFYDAAENYPVPPKPEWAGRTEEIVGKWLETKDRDAVILATKVAGPSHGWLKASQRAGMTALDRHNITRAIEASLRRLGTDYVDLYQTHWPDHDTAYDETLETLDGLVRAGKVRILGCSNETSWGLMKSLETSRRLGVAECQTIQNNFSMNNRRFEDELAQVCRKEGVSLIPYSPLAGGVLSGKYNGGARPEGARFTAYLAMGGRQAAAERPGEQAGAQPAVAVLARRGAAQPHHRVRDLLHHPGHSLLPAGPPDPGQQVHVHVAVAGVSEDHGRDVARRGHPPDDADVVAHALDRDAGVLDHLERAAVLGQPRQDGTGGVAQLPEPGGALRRERGVHRRGPAPHRVRGLGHRPSQRPGVLSLDLHQQHRLGSCETLTDVGTAHQLEESPVEQLDRGRLERQQRRHHLHQVIQRAQLDAESRPVGWMRVEPPIDPGDESQGALRAHDEVEQIARGDPVFQSVPRGVLAGLGKSGRDQPLGRADRRGHLLLHPADRLG
jgi:aryl-alcohol dehydrogenase-like predicted oxidoreductase